MEARTFQREGRGVRSNGALHVRHAATVCVMPSQPRMLSWQQMVSSSVHREELHHLPQQCGTREITWGLGTPPSTVETFSGHLSRDGGFTEDDEE